MSASEAPSLADRLQQANDPYAVIEAAAGTIADDAIRAVERGEAGRISDEAVTALMTAAVKLYAAKCDGERRTFRPVRGNGDEIVTPTEALTAVTEVLRALRLGPTEFALWARRKPENYHDIGFDGDRTDGA